MVKINMQFFGGNGASSKKSGAGGAAKSDEPRTNQMSPEFKTILDKTKVPAGRYWDENLEDYTEVEYKYEGAKSNYSGTEVLSIYVGGEEYASVSTHISKDVSKSGKNQYRIDFKDRDTIVTTSETKAAKEAFGTLSEWGLHKKKPKS